MVTKPVKERGEGNSAKALINAQVFWKKTSRQSENNYQSLSRPGIERTPLMVSDVYRAPRWWFAGENLQAPARVDVLTRSGSCPNSHRPGGLKDKRFSPVALKAASLGSGASTVLAEDSSCLHPHMAPRFERPGRKQALSRLLQRHRSHQVDGVRAAAREKPGNSESDRGAIWYHRASGPAPAPSPACSEPFQTLLNLQPPWVSICSSSQRRWRQSCTQIRFSKTVGERNFPAASCGW